MWGVCVAAIRRLCWRPGGVLQLGSEDVGGLVVATAPAVAFRAGSRREGVNEDAIVARVNFRLHSCLESFDLGGTELTFENTALYVV